MAVVTCVIFGSTLNKCLTCFQGPVDAPRTGEAVVRGTLLAGPFEEEAPPLESPSESPFEFNAIQVGRSMQPRRSGRGQQEHLPAESIGEPIVIETEDEENPPPAIPVPRRARSLKTLKAPPLPKALTDHEGTSFDNLADYPYEFEESGTEVKPKADQIPEGIQKMTGKNIAIKGFMIPLKNEGEEVIEFVLVRNQGACCFGIVPRMNEWIHVKMEPGQTAPYALDIPITVFGKFDVGEVYENGLLMSIYRMASTYVLEPPIMR